jgi:hypothetical protein
MFDKDIYNQLLDRYVQAVVHWDNHPLSSSAKRDTLIAKAGLDTYIRDHIRPSNVILVDDMEPIHRFFRD